MIFRLTSSLRIKGTTLLRAAVLAGVASLLPVSAGWAQPSPGLANSSERPAPERPAPERLVQPADADDVIRYSDDTMAVSLPKAWEIKEIENGIMVSNLTTTPAELVATQIVNIEAPPGAVVNANIDSFMEEGAIVGRYRTVMIDGQSALVMWLSNRPDELSNAIATFIGYGNQTVLLFSRYASDNETAEESILQMHTSFSNLAIQTASVEESN
ncbi:MAG: hypothetical protein AAF703_07240 [Cyanobacteria bacterium P01_D01_bin.105]